jgi:hypothetical protein
MKYKVNVSFSVELDAEDEKQAEEKTHYYLYPLYSYLRPGKIVSAEFEVEALEQDGTIKK